MKQRVPLIVCCCLLLLSLGLNLWLLQENRQLLATWQHPEASELTVHVTGAVACPGVYNLAAGARIADALELAGGPLPEALLQGLNLAKPLFDGEQVHIAQTTPIAGPTDDTESFQVAQTQLININTATLVELEALPGIGPVKAQAIVDYRQQHGAFARIEDLTKVSGIGTKTFDTLKHLITV